MISRITLLLTTVAITTYSIAAQTPGPIATIQGKPITASSLSPEAQQALGSQKQEFETLRQTLYNEMAGSAILELESKATNISPEKLIAAEAAKAPSPTAEEIQKVYDANRSVIGSRPLTEVKDDIVAFLRREPEEKLVAAYIESLKTKYKYTKGKSINTPLLAPSDVLGTLDGKNITVQEFNDKNKLALNDAQHHQYEHIRGEIEIALLNSVVELEAKARGTDASSIIASEVTDKMRDFSEEEREALETALMNKLFAKYQVKLLLKEPETIKLNVSVDDDPSFGPVTAPVTVIMFSDFQCPACSRTHPVLKKVIKEYGDKVRFVIRDYPLTMHPNAFDAALAANAAAKQGKFLEYTEKLYQNQDSLDRPSLIAFARELGLNEKQFEIDLTDAANATEVRKDMADGEIYGVGGTPSIFVNGVKVHSLSASAFRRAIDKALGK